MNRTKFKSLNTHLCTTFISLFSDLPSISTIFYLFRGAFVSLFCSCSLEWAPARLPSPTTAPFLLDHHFQFSSPIAFLTTTMRRNAFRSSQHTLDALNLELCCSACFVAKNLYFSRARENADLIHKRLPLKLESVLRRQTHALAPILTTFSVI